MNLLATRSGRIALFTALYLSEGAPIGFVWWALPPLLRKADFPVDRLTAITSLLLLPWALKFLWAPLVDAVRGPRWTLRHWIVAAQVLMGATLLPLFWLDLAADITWVVPLLFVHAFAAATQDASIDALAISSVAPEERGRVNGFMQAGMLLGRSVFGGGALILAEHLGQANMILLLLAAVWFSLVLVIGFCQEPASAEPAEESPAAVWQTFGQSLLAALEERNTWAGLAFALTAGAGFEAVGAVAGPYLTDLGFEQDEVGWFFAVPVVTATMVGSLVGGGLTTRWGARRSVAWSQSFFVAAIVALAVLGLSTSRPGLTVLGLLAAMYFGIGLFTASSYTLLMNVTHPRVAATQFSAFMGATNGCEMWAGYTIGRLHSQWGYPTAFLAMAAVSLALVPLSGLLRPLHDPNPEPPDA